jgi:hypothetical protein
MSRPPKHFRLFERFRLIASCLAGKPLVLSQCLDNMMQGPTLGAASIIGSITKPQEIFDLHHFILYKVEPSLICRLYLRPKTLRRVYKVTRPVGSLERSLG